MRKYIASLNGDDPVLTCEDDIIVCTNLHAHCQALLPELRDGVALISLYLAASTRKWNFLNNTKTLLEWTNPGCFNGGLCWLWNPQALKEIARSAEIEEKEVPWGVETFVTRWARRKGYKILLHQPSLVQHADNFCPTDKLSVQYSPPNPMTKEKCKTEVGIFTRYSDTFVGEQDWFGGMLGGAS